MDVLETIQKWIMNKGDDVPPAYLVSGVAGVGKSAIMHTIARQSFESGNLAAFYCFDRTLPTQRTPQVLFRRIAEQFMASKSSMCGLGPPTEVLQSALASVERQFEELILTPAQQSPSSGRHLIVIDALDESGNASSRRDMLSVLARRLKDLPSNFRVLLSARPEEDIANCFDKHPSVSHSRLIPVPDSSIGSDIFKYIRHQLSHLPGAAVGATECQALATKAEGLFQWAYVACEFIKTNKIGDVNPGQRYERFMVSYHASRSMMPGMTPLDQLYHEILSQLFDDEDEEGDSLNRFRSVMGHVLTALEPFSCDMLTRLRCSLDGTLGEDDVWSIVRYMGALLNGTHDRSALIYPLHTSFRDFLVDESRSGIWSASVNTIGQHRDLALSSLRVMQRELRFNICDLESSFLRNQDVPDIEGLAVEGEVRPARHVKPGDDPPIEPGCDPGGRNHQHDADDEHQAAPEEVEKADIDRQRTAAVTTAGITTGCNRGWATGLRERGRA